MTEVEKLEASLQKLRTEKTKAEVVVDQIQKKWQEDYETSDVEEVKILLNMTKERLAKNTALRDEKLSEANKLLGAV